MHVWEMVSLIRTVLVLIWSSMEANPLLIQPFSDSEDEEESTPICSEVSSESE